jgi:hypothetical protein
MMQKATSVRLFVGVSHHNNKISSSKVTKMSDDNKILMEEALRKPCL